MCLWFAWLMLHCLPGAMAMSTKRGNQAFGHGSFIYIFDRMAADKVTKLWRCEQKGRCPVRIHTAGGEVIKTINEHSHDSNPAKIVARQAVTEMKRKAANTVEDTAHILNRTLQDVPQTVLGIMPQPAALKKTIRRVRNGIDQAPEVPENLRTLSIPENYRFYLQSPETSEDFLLSDSGPDSASRIFIFDRTSLRDFGRQKWCCAPSGLCFTP